MKVETFCDILEADFYTGVPDSLLSPLCDYLMSKYSLPAARGACRPDPAHHVIGANEGSCAALAAGYHLATGRVPVVYLQNSGEGNLVNPAASLLHPDVYGIPVIFVVGWRGEPGVQDEPQHLFQGKITESLLAELEIKSFMVGEDTTEEVLRERMADFRTLLGAGKSVAFLVRKGALSFAQKIAYGNAYAMTREEAVRAVAHAAGEDIIVSTTGKASRELYEAREETKAGHARDFLTVGSMGHASAIALGIALQKRGKRIWCIDGDGAVLMHAGTLATIGAAAPADLIHVVIRNEAHESVGGAPVTGTQTDYCALARAFGYPDVYRADSLPAFRAILEEAKRAHRLCLIEVCCAAGARKDLGRPKESPSENKELFMTYLRER